VALTAPAGELHDALASLEDDLRFVLITSAAPPNLPHGVWCPLFTSPT